MRFTDTDLDTPVAHGHVLELKSESSAPTQAQFHTLRELLERYATSQVVFWSDQWQGSITYKSFSCTTLVDVFPATLKE